MRCSSRTACVISWSATSPGAIHAAEGYARSTGKVGTLIVTSGPGATNTVTGLTDAMMDSIPVVCLTGQVATHLIGNDAFQEADTVGITRPCTKHNYLVRDVKDLSRIMHEAFYVARSGRPGPVVVDLPKDVTLATGCYTGPKDIVHRTYKPQVKGDKHLIREAVAMIAAAKRPIFYSGGGVINSGPKAAKLLTKFVRLTGMPITNTVLGLGGYPGSDGQFLGMLGMHGTYEANMAMAECDVMIAIGARFDDRITGRLDCFSQGSRKIHVDIDPSSINKNVRMDIGIVGDVAHVVEAMIKEWRAKSYRANDKALKAWWHQIDRWRARQCLRYQMDDKIIKPQYAIERLYHFVKDRDTYITTEVGQHQMWAAQFFKFEEPNRWMTSGGLGTMGYGLPAAIGAQVAHPDSLVIDVAGESSIIMNFQEMSTIKQHRLPVKVFIINNQYMGMVRQWQELMHDGRYSESYMEALPDFVKLAEAYGALGLRATRPDEVDGVIGQMIETDGPVVVDVVVDREENCFPMIPSGAAHYDMLLGPNEEPREVSPEGLALV